MKILGISAYYHDSAASLIVDGKIISAAQEERFTRKKHDSSFPRNAIQFCIDESNIQLSDLDYIVFYERNLYFICSKRIQVVFNGNASMA